MDSIHFSLEVDWSCPVCCIAAASQGASVPGRHWCFSPEAKNAGAVWCGERCRFLVRPIKRKKQQVWIACSYGWLVVLDLVDQRASSLWSVWIPLIIKPSKHLCIDHSVSNMSCFHLFFLEGRRVSILTDVFLLKGVVQYRLSNLRMSLKAFYLRKT